MNAPDNIARLLLEASGLGLWFRLSGGGIELLGQAPEPLLRELKKHRVELWQAFGGPALDQPAIQLLKELKVEAVLISTKTAAKKALADLRKVSGAISLDIETAPINVTHPDGLIPILKDGSIGKQRARVSYDGLHPFRARIATVQVYSGAGPCYVFWADGLVPELQEWLLSAALVIHNAAFELLFMRHYWGTIPPRFHCSMQALGLLSGVYSRSLAQGASEYLGLDIDKSLQTSDWGAAELSEGQVCYAAADSILTHLLWPRLQAELRRTDRVKAYMLQRAVIPPVIDMELRGVGLDVVEHARHVDRWTLELCDARRKFTEAAGHSPPQTPEQIRAFLTAHLSAEDLELWPRTKKTDKLSTARAQLLHYGDVPAVRSLISILEREKLLSVFGSKLRDVVSDSGRIHASFNVAAAKSGRFTSSSPNLQQCPSTRDPPFKSCFVAKPGYVLVGADYSQIELRACAHISGDAELTAVYTEGRDLHAETAALVLDCDVSEVTKEQRTRAKPCNFGAIYGISARSLCATAWSGYQVEMTLAEAEQALASFFGRYRTLKRWMGEWSSSCKIRRRVPIGCGRVVEANWEAEHEIRFNVAVNLPIQGACADALMRAMVNVHRDLQAANIDGGLALSVHDELILEVPEADAARASDILRSAMLRAFEETFPEAPTNGLIEVTVGQSWAGLK